MTVTPFKVLGIINLTEVNAAEERVCVYLNTMIGNMQANDLQVLSKIKICFNELNGFSRRPICWNFLL